MNDQDKMALTRSAVLSLLFHAVLVFALIAQGLADPPSNTHDMYVILSEYDPLGGEPGGLASLEDMYAPVIPLEMVPPEPEQEQMDEIIEEPEVTEEFELIESDNGELMPVELKEPPKEEPKKEPKPKPKPKTPPPVQTVSAVNNDKPGPPAAGQSIGPGQGGFGGGTGKGTKKLLDSYVSKVRSRMDRNKKYPARSEAKSGVVEVNFTIHSDGKVTGARIVASSGHAALDDEVMALVRRVTPFAPIPAELQREQLNLTVPVVFTRR
jgi:protein TonB